MIFVAQRFRISEGFWHSFRFDCSTLIERLSVWISSYIHTQVNPTMYSLAYILVLYDEDKEYV